MVAYKKPLHVHISDTFKKSEENGHVHVFNKAQYYNIKKFVTNQLRFGDYDYIMVDYASTSINRPSEIYNTDASLRAITAAATDQGIKVFDQYIDQINYLNPRYNEGVSYQPRDEDVMTKYLDVATDPDTGEIDHHQWENFQDLQWRRMLSLMPLHTDKNAYHENHFELLNDPSRGLDAEDLTANYSWTPNKILSPAMLNDNMVGIPSIKAKYYNDIILYDEAGDELDFPIVSAKTGGMSGYTIPMRNEMGKLVKFQIGADTSKINIKLKARAGDGVSIQHSEYFSSNATKTGLYRFKTVDNIDSNFKIIADDEDNEQLIAEDIYGQFVINYHDDFCEVLQERDYLIDPILVEKQLTGESLRYRTKDKGGFYTFEFTDGQPTFLKIVDANNTEVRCEDLKGPFTVPLKANLVDYLKEQRDYAIPEIIDTLKAEPNSKYIWPALGDMVGSKEMSTLVTASKCGFIVAREPIEGDEYTMIIVEGALKGQITAKYINAEDKEGESLANMIGGTDGIIIAQVPGVNQVYLESTLHAFNNYNVTSAFIAMDADGRSNLNVARGIHNAYDLLMSVEELDEAVAVLSWNPEHKGIDDALLSINRGEITLEDMGITLGDADTLFPIYEAEAPIPYKLNGERAYGDGDNYTPEWKIEYSENVKATELEHQDKALDLFSAINELEKDTDDFIVDFSDIDDQSFTL